MDIMPKIFTLESKWLKHYIVLGQYAQCKHCKKKISIRTSTLRRHLVRIHNIYISYTRLHGWIWKYYERKESTAQCKICGRIYLLNDHFSILKTHLVFIHNIIQETASWIWRHYTKQEFMEYYQCNICNKILKEENNNPREHLKDHNRKPPSNVQQSKEEEQRWLGQYYTTSGEYKARCNECGKKITGSYYNVQWHLRHNHMICAPSSSKSNEQQPCSRIDWQETADSLIDELVNSKWDSTQSSDWDPNEFVLFD